MAARQITCTTKAGMLGPSTERYITHVGGPSFGKITEDEAISDIEHDLHNYYISEGGKPVTVHIQAGKHRKFLKSEADGYFPNNLVNLPHCP